MRINPPNITSEHPSIDILERAKNYFGFKSSISPNEVSDEDFDRLKNKYSDVEIIELVSVISRYAFLNKFNSTLARELEETPKRTFQSLKIKNYES